MKLDHCPTCGRRITDFDPNGCELDSGQRWCLDHGREANALPLDILRLIA